MLNVINANITGKSRRITYRGRDTIVAPLSMIVPGVLNGSKGPLFYPEDEIQKNPIAWNGMPIVVDHPSVNGQPVSARDPEILETSQIGEVHHATYQGKLIAEGYFDVERTRLIDERVLNSLEANRPIELSTGLMTDNEDTPGEFNGIQYNSIARNYRPDHLAILPDQRGACSLKDGCGVLVNEESDGMRLEYILTNETGERLAFELFDESSELVENKSLDDIRSELQRQLQGDQYGTPEEHRWVEEVFLNGFIYSKNGKLWRLPYKVRNEVLTIVDARPEQVQLFKRYVPVDAQPNLSQVREDEVMNREQMISDMIANCGCYDETDRPILNKMSDDKLKKLYEHSLQARRNEAVANAARQGFEHGDVGFVFNEETGGFDTKPKKPATPPPTTNATPPAAPPAAPPQPQSFEQWMGSAPPQVQAMVKNAMAWEHQQKQDCITKITANKRNVFTVEQLGAMSLDQLRGLAALAHNEAPEPSQFDMPSFFGASVPVANQTNVPNDPLIPMSLNFNNEKEDEKAA